MADPASYRPAQGEIPVAPGVYRFRDDAGRVIYVGKAKSLRPRLSSYFLDLAGLHQRTQQMVLTASSVDWTVVDTEVEALALEYSWIKEFDPRFNVKYRDDKSYPWLAVTVGEEFPRVTVMRGAQRKGVRYFGPYGHAWAIRDTVDTLLRVFPMRSCSQGVFRRAAAIGRPCLLGDIGKCAAPCVGRVTAEEHRAIVDDFLAFMGGQTAGLTKRIEKRMHEASDAEEYELAAKLRDDLGAMQRVLEKQTVVLGDGTDADVLGFVDDPLEVAVQIFSVRGGRIRGQRGWVADKTDEAPFSDLVQNALMTLYEDAIPSAIPRDVLVPMLPSDANIVTELLSERRGGPVTIRVPRRGDKRALMATVEQNAKQSMMRHKMKRSSDLTARSLALEEIQEALGLPTAPLRIECYDISNLQGTEIVASMVVFEDGLPRKSEYRRFTIQNLGDGSHVHDNAIVHAGLHWRDNGLGAYQDHNSQVQMRSGTITVERNVIIGAASPLLSLFRGAETNDGEVQVTFQDNYFAETRSGFAGYFGGAAGAGSSYTFRRNFFRALDFSYTEVDLGATDPKNVLRPGSIAAPVLLDENTWEGDETLVPGLTTPNGTAGVVTATNNVNGAVAPIQFADAPDVAGTNLEFWVPATTRLSGSPARTYAAGEVVLYLDGNLYRATAASTNEPPPDNPTKWELLPLPVDDYRVVGSAYAGFGVD